LGEHGLDEILDTLDKTAKRVQKVVDETKEATTKQTALYEGLLASPLASQEQKLKAFIGKTLDLDRLERLNSQLSLLYTLQIFAFKVKVIEVAVCKINEQLVKNIDALKILIEAHYESMKEINETQNKNLGYIQ
jgi:hypothetical protein